MYHPRHKQPRLREYDTWWTVPAMLIGTMATAIMLGFVAFV